MAPFGFHLEYITLTPNCELAIEETTAGGTFQVSYLRAASSAVRYAFSDH